MKIDEHEIGYIALHVHAAIEDEKVSQAMQIARAVRECVTLVEQQTGMKIDVMSLAYNRLMNHCLLYTSGRINSPDADARGNALSGMPVCPGGKPGGSMHGTWN